MNKRVQSGRTSAVALVPESNFGKVPLTGSAVGVAATNPLRACIVEAGGGFPTSPEKEVGRGEVDGQTGIKRVILTGYKFMGKDAIKVDPEAVFYALSGILGIDIQSIVTAAANGQPAVYQHRLRRGRTCPSYTVVESFGDGSSGRLSSGVVVEQIQFTFGSILAAAYDYGATHQIPATYPNRLGADTRYDFTNAVGVLPIPMGGDDAAATPISCVIPANFTYVDVAETNQGSGPLVWGRRKFGTQPGFAPDPNAQPTPFAGSYVTINGQPVNALITSNSTLTLKQTTERFQVGDSGFDYTAPCVNEFEASGKLEILFQDNSISQAVLDNSSIGVCLRFDGVQIGTTGNLYTLEVYLPKVKGLTAETTRGNTAMKASGDYVAVIDPTKADQYTPGGYEVEIRLVNTFDASRLAGQAGASGNGSDGQNAGLGGRQVFVVGGAAPAMSASVASVQAGSNGVAVTVTGANTAWTNATVFTATNANLTNLVVNAATQTATFTLASTGAAGTPIVLADAADAATAICAVTATGGTVRISNGGQAVSGF